MFLTRNDFSYSYNRVSFEFENQNVQFIVWDFQTFDQKTKDKCLDQLALIISLGGNFKMIEDHMRHAGFDCELEDIYDA